MKRYRYAYDKTDRTFTESDWIGSAWENFIRLDDDTDITYTYFLTEIFLDHLRAKTIVEWNEVATQPATPEDDCPFCKSRSRGIPPQSLQPYPCSKNSVGLCIHKEDLEAVKAMSVDDGIEARAFGPYEAISGTIKKVYPARGYVSVFDPSSGGEFLVRASRIYAHTKKKDTANESTPAKSGRSGPRKPPPPRDNAARNPD